MPDFETVWNRVKMLSSNILKNRIASYVNFKAEKMRLTLLNQKPKRPNLRNRDEPELDLILLNTTEDRMSNCEDELI